MIKINRFKETILSIVLVFMMVMSLIGSMPIIANATTESVSDVTHVHDGIEYQPIVINENQTENAIEIGEGNYYLDDDIISLNSFITVEGKVNLCLNGNILNIKSITVSQGATLNIYDCGDKVHKYKSSTSDSWKLDEAGDTIIKGGIISCNIIIFICTTTYIRSFIILFLI